MSAYVISPRRSYRTCFPAPGPIDTEQLQHLYHHIFLAHLERSASVHSAISPLGPFRSWSEAMRFGHVLPLPSRGAASLRSQNVVSYTTLLPSICCVTEFANVTANRLSLAVRSSGSRRCCPPTRWAAVVYLMEGAAVNITYSFEDGKVHHLQRSQLCPPLVLIFHRFLDVQRLPPSQWCRHSALNPFTISPGDVSQQSSLVRDHSNALTTNKASFPSRSVAAQAHRRSSQFAS